MFKRRHIISIFLLALFVVIQFIPSVINSSIHSHQLLVQEKKLNIQTLITTLSLSRVQWDHIKKHQGDEVELNGKLFDLLSISILDNKVIIKGFFDKVEDDLSSVSKDLKKKDQNLEKQNSVFNPMFFEEPQSYSFFKETQNINPFLSIEHRILDSFLQQDSPPPKTLLVNRPC